MISSITGAAPGPPGIWRACWGGAAAFRRACSAGGMVGPGPGGGGGPATGDDGQSSQIARTAISAAPAAPSHRFRRLDAGG
ncbi:MAG TPA: hypothetical protein VFB81_00335 [Myxococcales bacterium]|nr:hypothetical protein [Myxococcales bacterium]